MKTLNPSAYTFMSVLLTQYSDCKIQRHASEFWIWLRNCAVYDDNSADACVSLLNKFFDVAISTYNPEHSTFWDVTEAAQDALKRLNARRARLAANGGT